GSGRTNLSDPRRVRGCASWRRAVGQKRPRAQSRARRIKRLRSHEAWHRSCTQGCGSESTTVMPDDNAVAELVQQISAYLRDNPLACDTQEGIARWWLAEGTSCD